MKKTLLLFAAFLVASFSMQAQDLTLSYEGEEIGEDVTIWAEPSDGEIVFYAHVNNNTDRDLNVKVRRNQVEMVDGTSSQFCWAGSCWPPDTDESPSGSFVGAGTQSEEEFSAHYSYHSQVGTSTIEYTFFNEENEDQNIKVTVHFWASPEGIAEDLMQGGSISDIYPNPATNLVNVDYDLPSGVNSAKLRIVNLLGAVVKESVIEPNANKLVMDVTDLKGGVYFYTVLVNGDVYRTKKLIVQN